MSREKNREEVAPLGTWAQRERRYIVEWKESRYPGIRCIYNAAIGPVPQEIIKEMGFERAVRSYRPMRKKIDCLIFHPEKLIAAEAEIISPLNAVRDLTFYRELLKESPDLGEWFYKPHEMVLVLPYVTEELKRLSEKFNFTIDVFEPPWIKSYMEEFHKYWTKEGIVKRMERKRRLGLI